MLKVFLEQLVWLVLLVLLELMELLVVLVLPEFKVPQAPLGLLAFQEDLALLVRLDPLACLAHLVALELQDWLVFLAQEV